MDNNIKKLKELKDKLKNNPELKEIIQEKIQKIENNERINK